jgi:DNA-binding transcriptional LysR family regulator
MRLDYVESFYYAATIGDCESVAKKRHLVKAAVEVQLRKLEGEIGLDQGKHLVRSRGRRYVLTPEGERFLPVAERLLSCWRTIKEEFRGAVREPAKLRIGAIESVLHSWLVPWIEGLRELRPKVELELTVESSSALVNHVERGKLDLAFAASPATGTGVRARQLSSLELVFVGLRSHHRSRSYRLTDLAQDGLITFQRGSQPHDALTDLLLQHRIDCKQLHCVSSISAMSRMVRRGLGVATLPRVAIAGLAEAAELRVLSCDVALSELPVYVTWRSDPGSQTIDAVVQTVIERAPLVR